VSENISPEATLAHYSIVCRIGAGGVGELYRKRNTRLDREVASNACLPLARLILGVDSSRKPAQLLRSTIRTACPFTLPATARMLHSWEVPRNLVRVCSCDFVDGFGFGVSRAEFLWLG
jgi:hypothetical protein